MFTKKFLVSFKLRLYDGGDSDGDIDNHGYDDDEDDDDDDNNDDDGDDDDDDMDDTHDFFRSVDDTRDGDYDNEGNNDVHYDDDNGDDDDGRGDSDYNVKQVKSRGYDCSKRLLILSSKHLCGLLPLSCFFLPFFI